MVDETTPHLYKIKDFLHTWSSLDGKRLICTVEHLIEYIDGLIAERVPVNVSITRLEATTLKDQVTKVLYQNSIDDSEALRIQFEKIDSVIDKLVSLYQQRSQWVNCYDRVPTKTKYYTIRNWITGRDAASVYCDSKDSIQKHCERNGLEFPEFQWFEEL